MIYCNCRSLHFVMCALILVGASRLNYAQTVTLELTNNSDGTFQLTAGSSALDNAGLVSYEVALLGDILTVDHVSPNAIGNGALGNGLNVGFRLLRSADGASNIHASQDTITPGYLAFGMGQSTGDLSSLATLIIPEQASYGTPLLLATGTYGATEPSFGPTIGANVFMNDMVNVTGATVVTSVISGLACDFDNSGALDIGDVDLLSANIGTGNLTFDLTGDSVVDRNDLKFFITDHSKLHTWIGDSNLDGEFNSTDFVIVFQEGKFETGLPATWSQGDWTGDGLFTTVDFVFAFQDGGYEQGPRWVPQSAVPEPCGLTLILFGFTLFFNLRRQFFGVSKNA